MKDEQIKQIKKNRALPILFMAVVLIGALGVGVCILLSELLFPDIDEFSGCPFWYRLTMYFSILVAVGGIVGCIFTKNQSNTRMSEFYIELAFLGAGFFLCVFFALLRDESYRNNVLICVGGALCSVGLFCGIGTLIGLSKKPKTHFYSMLTDLSKQVFGGLQLAPPASLSDVLDVENYFGNMLPYELVELLLECNGDGDLLFSCGEIIQTAKLLRNGPLAEIPEVYKDIDKLCFFGGNGCGDYFCYKILDDGTISDGEIFLWNHETGETAFAANTLSELICRYYNGNL